MDVSSDCSSLGLRSVACSTLVKAVGKSCGLKLWAKADCTAVEAVWCRQGWLRGQHTWQNLVVTVNEGAAVAGRQRLQR